MSETSSGEIKQAINLLHSAEYWYDKYESDLSMIDNGHARTAKALQIIADEVNR
mgnify:CR=1 FL=1